MSGIKPDPKDPIKLKEVNGQLQLDNHEDKGFKKIADFLLHTDVRKHNRYCPCCKQYETANELSPMQMGEFLEYIR